MSMQTMGPPSRGPVVRVTGSGISVNLRVETELDAEIIHMAMRIAERRRYGRVRASTGQEQKEG